MPINWKKYDRIEEFLKDITLMKGEEDQLTDAEINQFNDLIDGISNRIPNLLFLADAAKGRFKGKM